jgi:Protein of unknown function DUF262
MPSELNYLDTFFNSRVFRIPDYQRGYAWGPRQLEDFWQDLNRLRENRNHYTGQLTIENPVFPEPIDVVDKEVAEQVLLETLLDTPGPTSDA